MENHNNHYYLMIMFASSSRQVALTEKDPRVTNSEDLDLWQSFSQMTLLWSVLQSSCFNCMHDSRTLKLSSCVLRFIRGFHHHAQFLLKTCRRIDSKKRKVFLFLGFTEQLFLSGRMLLIFSCQLF